MSIDFLRKEKKIDIDLVIWPSHDMLEFNSNLDH